MPRLGSLKFGYRTFLFLILGALFFPGPLGPAIAESDIGMSESNQSSHTTHAKGPLPDLGVQRFFLPSFSVTEGESFFLRIVIENSGAAQAGASHARLYLSDEEDFDVTGDTEVPPEMSVPALAPGATAEVRWDFNFPDILDLANYPIWVICFVDSQNEVAEINDGNEWRMNTNLDVTGAAGPTPTSTPTATQGGGGMALACGANIQGMLSVDDEDFYLDGTRADLIPLEIEGNPTVTIRMSPSGFVGYLALHQNQGGEPDFDSIDEQQGSSVGADVEIVAILGAGSYFVIANNLESGDTLPLSYSVSVECSGVPTPTPTEEPPTNTPTTPSTSTPTALLTPTPTANASTPTPTNTTPGATPTTGIEIGPVDRVSGVANPDLSGNGHVGSEDLTILQQVWGVDGNQYEDLSLNGRVDVSDLNTMVEAWNVSAPRLDQVSPAYGASGDSITLTGMRFGESSAEGDVSIQGARVPKENLTDWSDTSITFQIPAGIGGGSISVLRKQVPSNSLPFSKLETVADATLSPGGGIIDGGGGLSLQVPSGVVPSDVPFTLGLSSREGSPAYIGSEEEVAAVVYMDLFGENPMGATFTLTIPLSLSYPAGTKLEVLRISPISGQWGHWAGERATVQADGMTAVLETRRLETFLLKPEEEALAMAPPKGETEQSKQIDPSNYPQLVKVDGFGNTGTPIILVHGNRSEDRPSYSFGNVERWARQRPGFAESYQLYYFVHDSSKPMGYFLDDPDNSGNDLGNLIEQHFPDRHQHVILWAHSRGGLVCRTYMNYYDPPWGEPGEAGKRVASLVTFGSPHHGSPGIIGSWFFHTLNNHFHYWGKIFISPNALGNQIFTIAMGWNLAEDLHPITDERHRPGSVGLGWDNFDSPNGIPTDDFYYLINPNESFFILDPRDKNDRLEQLTNEERYKDRMIVNGGYFDWNHSAFNEPLHLVGSTLPIGDVNKEHIQLSVVSRVLGAFESEGMDDYLPHYVLNDGVVPLQGALFLSEKTPQADELLYETEESGVLFWKKTVPKQPLTPDDAAILARVQTAQARWWPQHDHSDMADGHTSNNFATIPPNTIDDFDLYEAAYDDLDRVPAVQEIRAISSKIGAGQRFRIRGSGFGFGEGEVFLTTENDPEAEGKNALLRQWGLTEIEIELPPDFEPGGTFYVFVRPLDPPLIPMMEGFPFVSSRDIDISLEADFPSSNLIPRMDLYVGQPDGSTVWFSNTSTRIGVLVEGEDFDSIISGYIAPNFAWEGTPASEVIPGTYTVRFHYHSLNDLFSPDPPSTMPPVNWKITVKVNSLPVHTQEGTLTEWNSNNNAIASTGPDWVDVTEFDPFNLSLKNRSSATVMDFSQSRE